MTRDNRKSLEYRAVAAIRKLRAGTNCPAGKSWPNHVKNEQHIGSEKTYGSKNTEQLNIMMQRTANENAACLRRQAAFSFAVPFASLCSKFADCSILDKSVHHCCTSPHLCREFGKGIKTSKSPVTLGHSGFKGSNFPREVGPVCNKYHIRALYPYLDFWRESFRARKKRLAPRGSGSQAHKIASPKLLELYT